MQARPVSQLGERLARDLRDALLVDLAHREHRELLVTDELALLAIEVAHATSTTSRGFELRPRTADVDQPPVAQTDQRRERHTVQVAADGEVSGVLKSPWASIHSTPFGSS